ncbi:TPA: DUF1080 domain-containing protein [Candidatus Poribacteria bacterium]|nr:DUF1080 domain-containing protein [Candidatus Poribacteria bacterium]
MKFLSVICVSLLFLALPVWGLFYDFENRAQLKEWEVIGGDWKIENGVLKGKKTPPAPGFDHGPGIVVGEDTWTDYVFELKMKLDAGKLGGPIIRYIDEKNWYWFESWRTQFYLRPHVNGEDQAPDPIPEAMWDRKKEFQDGEWHTYKIEAKGEDITAWFDGEKVLDFTYNKLKWGRPAHPVKEGLLRGKVGLMTWTGDMGMASFDDVSILGPGIPGATVNPNGRLSITWGEIKSVQ